MVGTDAELSGYNPYRLEWTGGHYVWQVTWKISLGFSNNTNHGVSALEVELTLRHAGTSTKERHLVSLNPIIGPGQAGTEPVSLRRMTEEGRDPLGLQEWRVTKVWGAPLVRYRSDLLSMPMSAARVVRELSKIAHVRKAASSIRRDLLLTSVVRQTPAHQVQGPGLPSPRTWTQARRRPRCLCLVFRTRLLQATAASRAVRVFQALVCAGDFSFHAALIRGIECRTVGVQ